MSYTKRHSPRDIEETFYSTVANYRYVCNSTVSMPVQQFIKDKNIRTPNGLFRKGSRDLPNGYVLCLFTRKNQSPWEASLLDFCVIKSKSLDLDQVFEVVTPSQFLSCMGSSLYKMTHDDFSICPMDIKEIKATLYSEALAGIEGISNDTRISFL